MRKNKKIFEVKIKQGVTGSFDVYVTDSELNYHLYGFCLTLRGARLKARLLARKMRKQGKRLLNYTLEG